MNKSHNLHNQVKSKIRGLKVQEKSDPYLEILRNIRAENKRDEEEY